MQDQQRKRLLEVCDQISKDMEKDAKEFDGQPFNGRVVATYFGNQGAAIAALSDIVKEILKNNPNNQ